MDGHGKNSGITGKQNLYLDFLAKYNLRNKYSYEKFIPPNYFYTHEGEIKLIS